MHLHLLHYLHAAITAQFADHSVLVMYWLCMWNNMCRSKKHQLKLMTITLVNIEQFVCNRLNLTKQLFICIYGWIKHQIT